MRLILNIGMHKTGSSSIQQSLHRYRGPTAKYLNIGHPNHSVVFSTMFRTEPHRYSAHARNNRTEEDVAALRKDYFDKIDQLMRNARGKDIIVSGEDIVLLNEDELRAMQSFFDPYVDEIMIVGYVRPPVSLMSSALQQRVAGGASIQKEGLYPNYRQKLEKFDTVFGRDRVLLTRFDRGTLDQGDVVIDFLNKAGVDPATVEVVRDNEGRSLEATSVMLAQRRFGRGFGRYPKAPHDNRRMNDLLRDLGTQKVKLHSDYWREVVDANVDDLAWISERLGAPLLDEAPDGPRHIRSPEDLLQRSGSFLPEVLELLAGEATDIDHVAPELMGRAMDLLHDVIRAKREAQEKT
ncbi:MAG: hypothetical protein AAFP16_02360 [Pseudomonadota bacterium]